MIGWALVAVLVVVALVVLWVASDPAVEDDREARRVFVMDALDRARQVGEVEDARERAARWREL